MKLGQSGHHKRYAHTPHHWQPLCQLQLTRCQWEQPMWSKGEYAKKPTHDKGPTIGKLCFDLCMQGLDAGTHTGKDMVPKLLILPKINHSLYAGQAAGECLLPGLKHFALPATGLLNCLSHVLHSQIIHQAVLLLQTLEARTICCLCKSFQAEASWILIAAHQSPSAHEGSYYLMNTIKGDWENGIAHQDIIRQYPLAFPSQTGARLDGLFGPKIACFNSKTSGSCRLPKLHAYPDGRAAATLPSAPFDLPGPCHAK